jgi:hypothetical protein
MKRDAFAGDPLAFQGLRNPGKGNIHAGFVRRTFQILNDAFDFCIEVRWLENWLLGPRIEQEAFNHIFQARHFVARITSRSAAMREGSKGRASKLRVYPPMMMRGVFSS